jgi:ubiquitin-like-conjugating enzyme ATG3
MFSSVSNESKFESAGTLTPEEFLEAGDQLVYKFPTWKWAPAANKNLEKPYLPSDKQYLVTKGVPCLGRVRDLDHVLAGTSVDKEDGWLVAGITPESSSSESAAQNIAPPSMNIVDDFVHTSVKSEFADLDSMLLEETAKDRASIVTGPIIVHPPNEDRTRTYDLSITWDKYYQTPRLWLLWFFHP